LKTAGRIALGIALLAAVVWYADPAKLGRELAAIDVRWFVAAVAASVVSNMFSAARWAAIARGLGMIAPLAPLTRMYFRGMTMNVLLPGATVSGDLLRGYQLAQQQGNPLLRSGLSVVLDRASGLWILCGASFLSLLGALALGFVHGSSEVWVYVAGLVVALALPWLPLPIKRLEGTRRQAMESEGPILGSIWLSVLVQVFSAMALWFCAFAAGVSLSYPAMLAAAAPIFIMGALPLGWGGFGAREAGAVVVLGVLGVAPEQATVTGLLYGLSAVLQGLAAAPLFVLKEKANPREGGAPRRS
jgi:uncharacterized membrane protein YbhN (UPF0104 family)